MGGSWLDAARVAQQTACGLPPSHGELCSLGTANANDTKSHSKHRGLIFFLSFVFPLQNNPKNFFTPCCHTCKCAEEHNVTFTTNEADEEGVRGAHGRAKVESFLCRLTETLELKFV